MSTQPRFKPSPSSNSLSHRAAFIELQKEYQSATLALSLRSDIANHKALLPDLLLYKELVLDLQKTPPLGLALDLMALWREGEQFTPRPLHTTERALRRMFLHIQNELLYRLLQLPSFQQLRTFWLGLPDTPIQSESSQQSSTPTHETLSLRDRALVFLLGQIFSSCKPLLVESFRPHPLSPFSEKKPPEWLTVPLRTIEQFEARLGLPGWLTEHTNTLLNHFLHQTEEKLLPASCGPILLHFEYLPNKLQRIRWQHMTENANAIPRSTQFQKLFALRDAGYREMKLPTRSTSPEGGYHGICRNGPIENMLHSELLFWDETFDQDHFSLRWIEGELLYYEREQSHTFTWQRQLTLVLDLDPGELRFKGPMIPTSGQALLFGLIARLFQDLRQICPEDMLRFEIILGPDTEWKRDSPLLRLFFSHLAEIGASTHFQLVASPIEELNKSKPKNGEMRLFVLSRSRWEKHQENQSTCHHHRSFLFAPTLPQSLLQTEDSGEFHTKRDDLETEQTNDQTKPKAATEQIHQQLSKQPNFQFLLEKEEDPFPQLAQLRDRMLESVLTTSLISKRTY